jgi:hypothetical protein
MEGDMKKSEFIETWIYEYLREQRLNMKDLSLREMDELHREAEESYNLIVGNEDELLAE